MNIRLRWLAALAAALPLGGLLAGSASSTPSRPAAHGPGQQVHLDQACKETVANVQAVVKDAPNGQVQAIHSHLQVVTPGSLIGTIVFSPSGKPVPVGSPRADAAATSFGCGEATARGTRVSGASGGTHVVSILHRRFTKPGRYELTFTLNHAGETMLAQLSAADKAYFKQHPHGQHPPTLGFSVALSYSPGG